MSQLYRVLTAVLLCAALQAQAARYTNQVSGASFVPQHMTVRAGDTIVWQNVWGHTVTGDDAEAFCGSTFFQNASDTCTVTFNATGTYAYHCIPHEGLGMTGTVTVEPAVAEPPTVTITSPANNATFVGPTNVLITATATDPDGTVTQVEFFNGASSLGTDTTAPYEANPNFAIGQHTLRAVATDNSGSRATSGPVSITITSPRVTNPVVDRIPKGDIAIELQIVADGLISPLGMAVPDDNSGRTFIYDQAGLIWVLNNGVKALAPALDLRPRMVTLGGNYDERGLLGLAVHPNFAQNPLIYTYTSETNGRPGDFQTVLSPGVTNNHQSVIAEWRISAGNANLVDASSRREILRIDQPQSNHNGGTMRFGPDGMLYIALGDGGAADDQGEGHVAGGNGQYLENVYGKVLRINVDTRNSANGQYGVPANNPFVGTAGIDEIYAYGLRNPFSFSFDRTSGALYLGDVGQNAIEELDIIVSGGNYGWSVKEGTFYFDANGSAAGYVTTVPTREVPPNLIDPIAQYDHDDGFAIVGGYVYRGTQFPALSGKYVTGDWGTFGAPSGRLYYLDTGNVFKEFRIGLDDRPLGQWIKGFGEDAAGEVYVFAGRTLGPVGNSGRMLKIVPMPAPVQITQNTVSGNNVNLAWTGGSGQYVLAKREAFCPGWTDFAVTSATSASPSREALNGYFRVEDIANLPGVPFSAYLSGAMERPNPVTTAGSGFAVLRLDGNTLFIDLRYENLSSPASMAHIHGPSTASGTGGILVDLEPYNGGSWGTNGTISGAIPLTPAVKAAVLAGRTYVNIHSGNFGSGEIRGQVAPVLMQAAISGPSERPVRESGGVGQATMLLVGTNLTFNITYQGLTTLANNAHIHGPAETAGSAGVLRDLVAFHDGPLAQSGSFGGTMGLSPAHLMSVVDGLTYVNIHSTRFGPGEIRGQIMPKVTAIPLSASLSGAAEKPNAVTTPGTGIGTFRLEGTNLIFEIRYRNLLTPAFMAHIHGPANSSQATGVLIDLGPYHIGPFGTNGAFGGSVPLTPTLKATLLSGQTYVNIHTTGNPGGEIRGQIGTVLLHGALAGNNEVPAVTSTGNGSFGMLLVGDRLTFDVTYRNLMAVANNAHIHGPASASQSAGVLVDLVPFNGGTWGTAGSFVGSVTLTPSILGSVIDGLTYVNVHSPHRSTGEVRGQILK